VISLRLAAVVVCSIGLRGIPDADACATAPPRGEEVQIAEEEAVITWDPATRTEHFIRRASFHSTARAAAGEEIIIAKNGVPLARLVALEPRSIRWTPGGWEEGVQIADDFDAPLPADLLAAFGE
jgi:antitoxin (DNA-binding transcriptional repressor) of toxin-antitoxin stability system